MTENEFTIQELVDLSGVTRRNIYFYAQQGILPPPQGAGLAARYSQIHLLRLRAIPCLRESGLRLDEIRQRLANMDDAGLVALLARQPLKSPSPPAAAVAQAPTVGSSILGQAFIHYSLPRGIVLAVPASLTTDEQHKIQLLLASAARILADSHPENPDHQPIFC